MERNVPAIYLNRRCLFISLPFRLETALLRQPRRSLDVFVLHRHEGLTYRAIAERLAISVSAVEKHMMRILLACDLALSA